MANRPGPTAAARAAVAAAANVTRGIEQALLRGPDEAPEGKPDGRRQRWEKHKQARRTELTDGTTAAVRELGADVGMDEIAAHIGVSKTVLYRYFADKNDLAVATAVRFFEVTLLPRLTETITDDADEYGLTRTVIAIYVEAVADEPNLYKFSLAKAGMGAVADSEKLVAMLLTDAIMTRLAERGAVDLTGAEVWSYTLIGGIQRAMDWWMTDRPIPVADLIDYLTMLVWSAIVGIARVNGSRADFTAAPPDLPPPGVPTSADPSSETRLR